MTFRTTVRDGMININTHGELPDGTPVEMVPVVKARPKRSKKSPTRKKPSGRSGKPAGLPLPRDRDYGAGSWAGRADTKDPVAFVKQLRRQAFKRKARD